MPARDTRDILGGGILVALGTFAGIYALTSLNVGSLRQMGPGMFPAALGFILVAFGVAIIVPAFFRSAPLPKIRVWSPIFVLGGVGGFAFAIQHFGLIPAILAVTIISSLAELNIRPISLAVLCAVLCAIAYFVVGVGLNLPVAMFRWPF